MMQSMYFAETQALHHMQNSWRLMITANTHTYFGSLMPKPVRFLGGGDAPLPLRDTSLPSAASRSRKSCQSSANDSLLLELLAINIGSLMLLREGVEGVRLKGDIGSRRPEEVDAVPGRARPACSRCSEGEVSMNNESGVKGDVPSVQPNKAEIS